MPGTILKIDQKKTKIFLEKLRALQHTDPAQLIPAIMEAGIEDMPGSVPFNVARLLGTSINQIRAWCAQSAPFQEAINVLASTRSAILLEKLEAGALPATSLDRLIFSNIGECFDPPKLQKNINADLSLSMINMQNIDHLLIDNIIQER
jgi:hypothetical protein